MALQVNDPLPDLLNLLLQSANGLQLSFSFRRQVISRVARFVFPLRRLGVQFGQAAVEPRGQGIPFDQGGFSTGIEFSAGSCTIARRSGGNAGVKRPQWTSLIRRKTLLNP